MIGPHTDDEMQSMITQEMKNKAQATLYRNRNESISITAEEYKNRQIGRFIFNKRKVRKGRTVPHPVRVKDLNGHYHDIWHIPIYSWQHSSKPAALKVPQLQYQGNRFGYIYDEGGEQGGQKTENTNRINRAQQALQALQAQQRRGQTRRQNTQGGRPQTQRPRTGASSSMIVAPPNEKSDAVKLRF